MFRKQAVFSGIWPVFKKKVNLGQKKLYNVCCEEYTEDVYQKAKWLLYE